MLAWRLCRERYAKLDGVGAARVGGRWNPVGLAMVYMSASDALAVLEVRVHLRRYIPDTYVFATAEIPDHLIERIENHSIFPADWRDNLGWSQSVGSKFVNESWSAALSVPSRIVPAARNILLNPDHSAFSQVVVQPLKKFEWDERLWDRVKGTFRIS
jgi:RES domain-containing protein